MISLTLEMAVGVRFTGLVFLTSGTLVVDMLLSSKNYYSKALYGAETLFTPFRFQRAKFRAA
jgi:hypothetical protein